MNKNNSFLGSLEQTKTVILLWGTREKMQNTFRDQGNMYTSRKCSDIKRILRLLTIYIAKENFGVSFVRLMVHVCLIVSRLVLVGLKRFLVSVLGFNFDCNLSLSAAEHKILIRLLLLVHHFLPVLPLFLLIPPSLSLPFLLLIPSPLPPCLFPLPPCPFPLSSCHSPSSTLSLLLFLPSSPC